MDSNLSTNPVEVIHRLHKAVNEHDLASMVSCFASDYQSTQPGHPARAFRGRAQVEKNWSQMFVEVPDFRMEIIDLATKDNQVWMESDWSGTLKDRTRFHWRGVSIFTIERDKVTAARLYMEPVEDSGLDIDATVKSMTHKGEQA